MRAIVRAFRRFLSCESGATATEYAVMLALVFLVIIGAVAALGTKVSSTFVDAEQSF
ncbi:MAG: Flp family type IVb pilin [Planctomycetota bacterium]|nr:MAG: Flp family type IVb pilin [Planctomycetota bacterium]